MTNSNYKDDHHFGSSPYMYEKLFWACRMLMFMQAVKEFLDSFCFSAEPLKTGRQYLIERVS